MIDSVINLFFYLYVDIMYVTSCSFILFQSLITSTTCNNDNLYKKKLILCLITLKISLESFKTKLKESTSIDTSVLYEKANSPVSIASSWWVLLPFMWVGFPFKDKSVDWSWFHEFLFKWLSNFFFWLNMGIIWLF